MKAILYIILFSLVGTYSSQAQYFQTTLDNDGNSLIVKVRPVPGGGDITVGIAAYDIFLRKADTEPNFTFEDITPNLTEFPDFSSLQFVNNNVFGSETGFTNYQFSFSIGAAIPTSNTYTEGTEYEVFRVRVDGDPGDMADFQAVANDGFNNTFIAIASTTQDFTDPGLADFFYGETGSNEGPFSSTTYFENQQNVALPVEFASFEVERRGNHAGLSWETASEVNVSHFEVMRSGNGVNWETFGKTTAENNAFEKQGYEYLDVNATEHKNRDNLLYYRIGSVDYDGSMDYTPVKSVAFDRSDEVNSTIKPNLATPSNDIFLNFVASKTGDFELRIVDMQGREIERILIQGMSISESKEVLLMEGKAKNPGQYLVFMNNNEKILGSFTIID